MKAKTGFGEPNRSDRLQSVQSQPTSLGETFISLKSQIRYKNGWDWRDWSAMMSMTDGPNLATSLGDLDELIARFNVSRQCHSRWVDSYQAPLVSGYVCICGHPHREHVDGGMCRAGSQICFCRKPQRAMQVSDVRHFYKATKGPHEAHALVLGLNSLLADGGTSTRTMLWVCNLRACGRIQSVNPVRMRNSTTISLGLSAHDGHKLMCEPCLFRELNS
jgi:hypothetical protein